MQIKKVDEENREAIAGVEFELRKMNGEIIGSFTTDKKGMIYVYGLEDGWYTLTETKAAKGYLADTDPINVQVIDGKTGLVTVTNAKASSILLHKIDSVTGEGIYGVTFVIYDANQNPFGRYTTDQSGYIFMDRNLKDGKYYIQEIEAAPGYILDNTLKTFYVEYGATSLITWKNTPQQGQIQVVKKSADYNPVNGFAAGTLLEGATFEIYDKAGNLVDTVFSNKNGLATSKTLPIGRYFVKEAQAPASYCVFSGTIEAEIEFSGQIVKLEILNSSATTGVSISKTGYSEAMAEQEIRYTINNIANTSTVALQSFYWRDTLAVDATRLTKIVTGTYSVQQQYKIVYKTNLNSTYRTMYDNLSTTQNYTLNASGIALGLASNEYVTEVMFSFGNVPAGFRIVETSYIYCTVLSGLKNGYQFVNNADVGGVYNGLWIMCNARYVTTIYSKTSSTLPRTGY